MKRHWRLMAIFAVAATVFLAVPSVAMAGGSCSPKTGCPGGKPLIPPGLDEGTPAPVRVSPSNNIVIDITGAGIANNVSVSNGDGIVIDITGAGIVIDITGAGLVNRPRF